MHICSILAILFASIIAGTQAATAQQQIILQTTSDQGTFKVEISWTPREIGSPNVFDIHFIEPQTGEEIEDVRYDFSINIDDHSEVMRRDQTTNRQEFTFDKAGPYQITIDDIEGLGERVVIPIQVTPEFPAETIAVIAVIFGAVAIVTRQNSNNLFSQSSK